jgi:hypothetical protein
MVVPATLIRIGQKGVRFAHPLEVLFRCGTGRLIDTVGVKRLGQLVIGSFDLDHAGGRGHLERLVVCLRCRRSRHEQDEPSWHRRAA